MNIEEKQLKIPENEFLDLIPKRCYELTFFTRKVFQPSCLSLFLISGWGLPPLPFCPSESPTKGKPPAFHEARQQCPWVTRRMLWAVSLLGVCGETGKRTASPTGTQSTWRELPGFQASSTWRLVPGTVPGRCPRLLPGSLHFWDISRTKINERGLRTKMPIVKNYEHL